MTTFAKKIKFELRFAQVGDVIDIISPGSSKKPEILKAALDLLENWGLRSRVDADIFGDHFLYANTTEKRVDSLKKALYAKDSKIVWSLGGGYGTTRTLNALQQMTPPEHSKILIGFSDITALHIFLSEKWGWTTFHGPVIKQIVENNLDEESLTLVKDFIFGKKTKLSYKNIKPLNRQAENLIQLNAVLTGGNLSIIESSIGTNWQIKTENKILFFEDVNERAYRTAERLEHYRQAGLLKGVKTILFSEFTWNEDNPRESHLTEQVLKEFAEEVEFPVFRLKGVGHFKKNLLIPVNAPAELKKLNDQHILEVYL